MADARSTKAIKSRAWADTRRRRRRERAMRTRTAEKKPGRRNLEVSEKLEALKSLIPSATAGCEESSGDGAGAVDAEELFRETADYILRLKARVVVLQSLIRIYGSADQSDGDNAA